MSDTKQPETIASEMLYFEGGRGTGITFRRLCLAFEAASAGQTVAVISANANCADYYFLRANQMLAMLSMLKIDKNRRIIEFPGGGKIMFINGRDENNLHGLHVKEVVDD